jgi:ABC-type nickel/cobalt efflux system permease component RcnA
MDPLVVESALLLGLLLGLKHATDADHVVAVSAIVSQEANPWRGLWVGGSWALGHTTPLLLVGSIILLFRSPMPERLSHGLEFAVGMMLVALGAQVFWNLTRRRIHLHGHDHEDETERHAHLHTHELMPDTGSHHGFLRLGRPTFRLKSYVVGIVHGLAGSGAVMLLVLTTIDSFWSGMGYILVFGAGTVLSMGLITLLMGIPFALSGRFEKVNRVVGGVAGLASIILGAWLMIKIGFP